MANEYERQTLKEQGSEKEIYPNIISDCIPEDAVETSHIKDGAITTAKIAEGAVTLGKISGTFGQDRIDDNSISTTKIQDKAVTTAKIDNNAVTTNQILDGSITKAKLRDTSVDTEKIRDGAITTAKIAEGAVTVSKISNITQGNIVATQEYVDEHGGGGGGGTTLYNHRVRLLMLDSGCGNEGTVYFTVMLSTNSPLSVSSFKELFSEEYTDRYDPSDPESEIPWGMQGAYLCPKLHSCYTYYFGVGDEFGKDIELKYFLEEDYFMVGGYGSLTLVSVIDTVTPV